MSLLERSTVGLSAGLYNAAYSTGAHISCVSTSLELILEFLRSFASASLQMIRAEKAVMSCGCAGCMLWKGSDFVELQVSNCSPTLGCLRRRTSDESLEVRAGVVCETHVAASYVYSRESKHARRARYLY